MGFFGGKKDKDKDKETGAEQKAGPRPSRRAVVPGARPGAPPAQAPTTPGNSSGNKTAVVKPPPPRPSGIKPPAPVVDEPPAQPSNLISSPPRPKSKEPIMVGSSKPPEFSGSTNIAAARRGGPCRTGDAALLDFLENKANLLNSEQVAAVRAKAEEEQIPIDVAGVKIGFITEEQMVNALTQECWVPHLKVDKYEIRKKALDTVAREDALHFGVFPVDKLGSLLTLAMVNPLDAETIRVLESKTGLDIKKVVATRTEIAQGIEKYYSGAVVAQDASRSFTQDVEPKSVTQMLGKVAPSPAPPSRPMPVVSAPPPSPVSAPSDNIVPEIQDIDDLLSSDEAIAPAIIEPISIKAEAEVVPMEPVFEPVMDEPLIAAPKAPAARKAPSAEFQLGDAQIAEPTPPLNRKQPAAPAPTIAPEFEFEDPAVATPAAKAPAPAPAIQPPPRPAAPPVARPAPPVAKPPTSSFGRPPEAPKTATSRFTGTARSEKAGVINLIPVTEEEFQHAITHGKSHVFEKWVGLQSRNRIINAVAIDSEFDHLLAGLYASPRRV